MRKITFLLLLATSLVSAQDFRQEFIATDVQHFWKAYDQITKTPDSSRQYRALQELYLDKATPGLTSLMQVRGYSDQLYIYSIRKFPKFWKSVRKNMTPEKYFPEIEADIAKLKTLYPALKPAPIYFSVGCFRTNGTVHEGKVLIGCETALADSKTFVDELPDWRRPFYKESSPVAGLSLLCTHEYVHTQQKPLVENLLSKCLYEGVAEFVSCFATGKPSSAPAIAFGKANERQVVEKFVADMYLMSNDYNWIWGENQNELKVRDLGYYIGYEICERFYRQSEDKAAAIAQLIELDFSDEAAVERLIDAAQLFPKPVAQLYADYEAKRPTVVSISPFMNGAKDVPSGLTKITVNFSQPLNGYHTGIDFGPLGAWACPKISLERTWAADAASWTFEADLKPNMKYQILIPNTFRKTDGVRLKPYLIEFQTAD